MKTPARAAIILFILISILLFIVGIRLGKKIAQIDYQPQIQMLKQALKKQSAAKTPAFAVKKFVSTVCGVQFLYPAIFKESDEGTDEAKLTYQNQIITFHCNRGKIIGFNDRKAAMKSEGKRPIGSEVEAELYQSEIPKTSYVYFSHPENNKNILIRLPQSLWDLFAETVKFL